MRKEFHQYLKPTDAEIKAFWIAAFFCFDASVLLNVYGYSKETCEQLVGFFEKHAERVRLPHQFALEYCRNRAAVIIKQVSNYNKAEAALKKIRDEHFRPKRDHPYLTAKADAAFQQILEELEESRREMEALISSDVYCDRILAVFEGKVTKEPSQEEYDKLHKEAKERYAASVPPGYCDQNEKEEPGAFGDYIAWRQLIEVATKEKRDIILVTDDLKEDWWHIERERPVGPRPQLLDEFFKISGQKVHLYNSESFLRAAATYGELEIQLSVIEEVTLRLESQRAEHKVDLKAVPELTVSENNLKIDMRDSTEPEKTKSVSPATNGESLKISPEG
jgi:PIN like domain